MDKKEQLIAAKRVGGLESTTAYAEDVIDDLLKAKAEQHRWVYCFRLLS